jgi:hypothetical protein
MVDCRRELLRDNVSELECGLRHVPGRFAFTGLLDRLNSQFRRLASTVILMNASDAEADQAERIVARFLGEYYKIWQRHFPGLIKRAHWHVIFAARRSPPEGTSCRAIHRTLYGLYGTDIRTCIERIKDCERDGFIKVLDASAQPAAASPGALIIATDALNDGFDRHCRAAIAEVSAVFGDRQRPRIQGQSSGTAAATAIFDFFSGYEQKWRQACEWVVKQKGLTPAHATNAMDHLVTYQYWAIVMLLWSASPFGRDHAHLPALVIDEINSRMWDALRLGHLAIKERVGNLIRWGFFAEQTIKKHKAVSLTPAAGAAISQSLAETHPLLRELHAKLTPKRTELAAARSA